MTIQKTNATSMDFCEKQLFKLIYKQNPNYEKISPKV